jgi:hypothetical protein
LFKHIFIVELIVQLITNQYGKIKWKKVKERDGYKQIEYTDEELE